MMRAGANSPSCLPLVASWGELGWALVAEINGDHFDTKTSLDQNVRGHSFSQVQAGHLTLLRDGGFESSDRLYSRRTDTRPEASIAASKAAIRNFAGSGLDP